MVTAGRVPKALLTGETITKEAAKYAKMRIKDMLNCAELADKEVGRFRYWFSKISGRQAEDATKGELAVALYAYCAAVPREFIKRPEVEGDNFSMIPWGEVLRKSENETLVHYRKRLRRVIPFFYDLSNDELKDLLETRRGQCLALTSLYCMLAEEVGVNAKPFIVTRMDTGKYALGTHIVPAFITDGGKIILFDPSQKRIRWVMMKGGSRKGIIIPGKPNAKHEGYVVDKTKLYVDVLSAKSTDFHRKEDYINALKFIDDALAVDPKDCDALFNKGGILNDMKRHEEAMTCADTLLELNPNNERALLLKGSTLGYMGSNEAIKYIDAALHIVPDYVNALQVKSTYLSNHGDYLGALECAKSALKIEEDNTRSLLNAATASRNLGDIKSMLGYVNKAVKSEPKGRETLERATKILFRAGEYNEALKRVEALISLAPDNNRYKKWKVDIATEMADKQRPHGKDTSCTSERYSGFDK